MDDLQTVCDALAAFVEKSNLVKNVFKASDTSGVLEITKNNRIDIVFTVFRSPHAYGVSLIHTLQSKCPSVKIIGMVDLTEKENLIALIRSNVQGILPKHITSLEELNHCLRKVMTGKNYFAKEVEDIHERFFKKNHRAGSSSVVLTNREFEILQLLSHGHVTKQIAEVLHLKDTTIEDYRKTMLKKTGTRNTAELVAFAFRNGFL